MALLTKAERKNLLKGDWSFSIARIDNELAALRKTYSDISAAIDALESHRQKLLAQHCITHQRT